MYKPLDLSDADLRYRWRVASADVDSLEAQLELAKQRQLSFAIEDCRRRFASHIDPIVEDLRAAAVPEDQARTWVGQAVRRTPLDKQYHEWVVEIVLALI